MHLTLVIWRVRSFESLLVSMTHSEVNVNVRGVTDDAPWENLFCSTLSQNGLATACTVPADRILMLLMLLE